MSQQISRETAARAVDAWIRRLLPSPESSHRPDGSLTAFDNEVAKVRAQTRDALVQTLAAAGAGRDLCGDPELARRLLAHHMLEESKLLEARLQRLERTVGRSPLLWRRYRSLIAAIRDLQDPESDAVAGLLREIRLILTLAARTSLPWARRS